MDGRTQYVSSLQLGVDITITISIPASYSVDIDSLILKFIWRVKTPRVANAVLKKNKVRGVCCPTLRLTIKL